MMTVLRFGRHPADMTEMSALGYGAYFTSPEPALESIGPNLVVLRDPVSNATQSMYGSFDYSSPDALLASRVDRATLRDGAGELLLDWSGLQATVFDLMSAGDNAAVTAQLLSGNDLIVGGAGDDLLRGGVPQWRDEMRVTPGVYLQWQLDVSDNDRFVAGVANHLVHESTGDGDPALWRDDVLVLDRQTGTETWVSLPAGTLDPMANAGFPSLSGDGRYLAFQSEENALAGLPPWPRYAQVYVRDLQTGNLVVASSTADGTPAEFGGMLPMLSSSGRFALFQSSSGDLSPDLGGYGPTQVYVKDLQTGALERASEAPDGSAANQESGCATISADGRVAAFLSLATNLAPGFGDGDLAWVYVKDLDSGEIDAVAPLYPSIPGGAGADAAYAVERFRPALSADGRYVAFVSTDATLVPDDTNGVADVFVKDLQTGAVVRASVSESGGQLSVESYAPELSADGRLVVFATASQDVVQASPQSFSSYYLRDLDSGSVLPMTAGTPFPNTPQVLALAPGSGLYAYLDWGPGYPEHLVVRGLSGTGDDTIEGGAGLDTVILSGAARDYRLDWDGSGGWTATPLVPGWGPTELAEVERLRFGDKTVFVEAREHGTYDDLPDALWHFFIVAFDAAPGVAYMDQLAEAWRFGLSVPQIVEIFTTKHQFTDVYPSSLGHRGLAEALVANIVEGSAGAEARLEAIGEIESALGIGWTVGQVVHAVFGNLASKPPDDPAWGETAMMFQNEITVAKYYTEVMNQSTTDLATLRAVIDPVAAATDVSSADAIAELIGVALLDA